MSTLQHKAEKKSPPIFLIGYMGSGKTTLGRALAARPGVAFVDLDEYIEQSQGRSITAIFADEGEAGFRHIEREALRQLASEAGADTPEAVCKIIACGGGTPCFHGNMELMNSLGVTVWLQADHATLLRRLSLLKAGRPLIASKTDSELAAFIADSLASREPHYAKAMLRLDANRLEDEAQIAETMTRFDQLLHTLSKP